MEAQIIETLNEFLKVQYIEEAFLCVIVHKPDAEKQKCEQFTNNIISLFQNTSSEGKDAVLRVYLLRAAHSGNLAQLKVLMDTLHKLVTGNLISARVLCDKILSCDKLAFQNKSFWIECFKLIKKIITNVDYKGVREIMKACRDKASTFPTNINVSFLPQLLILEDLIQFIFDRNNCLLPAYFIANELIKSPQPSHWKINKLMTDFVEEFRNIAQMVTIINHNHMYPVVETFGYADHLMNSWKLDPHTLKYNFKGNLPYDIEIVEPQPHLVRYVLDQPYSKEMIAVMLNLQKQQKQRCHALEEQLVWLIISAMERSEHDSCEMVTPDDKITPNHWLWLHLSSQLIYFVLFQFVNFMHIIISLHEKLSKRDLRKGRDQLMWILLQFISGSIQKNPLSNFLPMFKLFDILYPEQEPLKVPDLSKPSALRQMAPICIWIHLMKKARLESVNITQPIPIALKAHHEFLSHLAVPGQSLSMSMNNDYRIILLCNAYSTNQEYFSRPMALLTEYINSKSTSQMPVTPLSIVALDGLTVHSKMSLMHSFVSQVIKQAQTKGSVSTLTPALIETYSRLLVYSEIESLGIKGFLSQLLPAVFKQHAWGILHTLLEMFSYRLHHIPTHYRVQLLSHLHSLASVPQTNKMQLNLCFESTALRIITGLGAAELQPQLSRYFNEKTPGSVASSESEELNRVLIMCLGRAMHIMGSGNELQPWCKELLTTIMQNTPMTFANHSLTRLPPALAEFLSQNNAAVENKQLLKKSVDEEYRNWTSMSNENDIIAHFIRPNTTPLFLCLIFKMIWETDTISPVAYKILEGITARALNAHLRKLCDFLVFEVANSTGKTLIHKYVDTMNKMIWQYHIVPIDRVILCLVLRYYENSDAHVCFLIIQLMILKTNELRIRLNEVQVDYPADHWKQSNWHDHHIQYRQKFPEKFGPDESASHSPLPIYYGNVCFRFLSVLDIVTMRFIEIGHPIHGILEIIFEHLGSLYKFHERPITFLYNTFNFYERDLKERVSLKKKMLHEVMKGFKDIRPANWVLSEPFTEYLQSNELLFNPEMPYYIGLVRRLADAITGKNYFYVTDWRFYEFPNAPTHAMYSTCLEVLALPLAPKVVVNNLIDTVVKGNAILLGNDIQAFINAIGVIIAALPESYWSVVYERLVDALNSPKMVEWNCRFSAFELFNFKIVREAMLNKSYAMLLAVAHSVFHHMGCWKLITMIQYLKEKLKPCVQNEHQLVFVCHIFGPFLQRLESEKSNAVAEIGVLLYEMLEVVDKNHGPKNLDYMDPICDFLYHIKYIHVGNIIKNESEAIIKRLRPALQMRLRFISHFNVEEIGSEKTENVQQPTQAPAQQPPVQQPTQPAQPQPQISPAPQQPQAQPQLQPQQPQPQPSQNIQQNLQQQALQQQQQQTLQQNLQQQTLQQQVLQQQAMQQQNLQQQTLQQQGLQQSALQQQNLQQQALQQQNLQHQQLHPMQQQQLQQQQLQQQQFQQQQQLQHQQQLQQQQFQLQQQQQLQQMQQQQLQQQQMQLQQQQLQQQGMGMRHN